MARYFQNGNDYIAVTDEFPAGFKGVALVGRDRLGDKVFMVADLRKLPEVALADVPDEWVQAIGYDEPAPKVIEVPVFDDDGTLLDLYPEVVEPARYEAQPQDNRRHDFDIGLAIGTVLFLIWFFVFR